MRRELPGSRATSRTNSGWEHGHLFQSGQASKDVTSPMGWRFQRVARPTPNQSTAQVTPMRLWSPHVDRRILLTIVVLECFAVAKAHDYWIEPKPFRASVDQPIDFAFKVGFEDEVEELAWRSSRSERCFVSLGDEQFDVLGIPDAKPALRFAFARAGTWTLGYRSFESRLELEPEKFEAYLKEEGLESILAARKERGESEKSGVEQYSRCAKALLRVGEVEGIDLPGPLPIGLTLELVAELDPYSLAAKTKFPVRLLLRGEPLAGALVEAVRMDPTHRTLAARSDAAGRVEFDLNPGAWMITAVHMERAPKGEHADWKSLWATLTFERSELASSAEPTKPTPPKSSPTKPRSAGAVGDPTGGDE